MSKTALIESAGLRKYIGSSIENSKIPVDWNELYKSCQYETSKDEFQKIFVIEFGKRLGSAINSIVNEHYIQSGSELTADDVYTALKEKHIALASKDIFDMCIRPNFDELKINKPTVYFISGSLADKLDSQ